MKSAGAGRGFVNPQRTDESNADYVSPADRYAMEIQRKESNMQSNTNRAAEAASKNMKAGGHVHHSEHYGKHAAGHQMERDKVKAHAAGHKHHDDHVMAMCGGGYMKGKK
jgi:hypothetical protein